MSTISNIDNPKYMISDYFMDHKVKGKVLNFHKTVFSNILF